MKEYILRRISGVHVFDANGNELPSDMVDSLGVSLLTGEAVQPPTLGPAIADRTYVVGSAPVTIDLSQRFIGAISYGMTPTNIPGVTRSGAIVTIDPATTRATTAITVSGTNTAGTATMTFNLTVNAVSPTSTAALPDRSLTVGDAAVTLALGDFFANAASYAVSPTGQGVSISGSTLTISAAAERNGTYTVTAGNSTGQTVSDAFALVVGAAVTAPSPFVAGDWTLATGLEANQLVVSVNSLPANGGSPITAIQYSANSGTWTPLGGAGTGSRTLAMPAAGTSYSVRLRAVNAAGNSTPSDTKTATSGAASSTAINAVVVIGASHEFAMFGKDLATPNAEATSMLAAAGHSLPVYGWATGGARLDQADDHYTAARNAFPNALILSQFGGNDVSNNRPYPGGQSTFNAGLSGLLGVASGDTRFYPASLTFRDYDDSTFITPANGSKPYNENLLLPWITTNFPHAMAPYGRPKLDLYRFVLNDFENLLDTDNVHFTPTGYAAVKDYYIDRIADILSGVIPVEIAERVYSGPPPVVTYPALTTAVGTPAYTAGRFGQAMNSNGSFWAQADTSLTPLTAAWGMEAWVRIPTVSRSNIFMGESGSAVYGVVRASGTSPAGQACFSYADASSTMVQLTGGPRIDNDAWHHVAVQFRSNGADLFVDGVLVASSAVPISATRHRSPANASNFTVGHYASPTAFIWSGQVDEVRIWDGLALTAAFTPRTTAYTTLPAGTVAYWALDGNLTGGIPA